MDETPVVTVFLRNRGEVLLLRRSDAVGSYPGAWGGVAGHVEDSPRESAAREIREETGLEQTTLVRAGEAFVVEDEDRGTRWRVHPFLFDCEHREVKPNWETDRAEWVAPSAILDRETVPDLWTSYDRVRPTVESVAADEDHGSATLSVRALEVLRDEAALAAREDGGFEQVAETARDLRAARPAMTAVTNRLNRAMASADPNPESVERAARKGIERALDADRAAAATAVELLGDRVATLSRSGTALAALNRAEPEQVVIPESRPGREGVGVAEEVAGVVAGSADAVTLTTDAGFAQALADHAVETLVVGADSVLADGRIVNKVGTRSAALAAAHEDIDVLVAAASDKISPDTEYDRGERPATEVYDGESAIAVDNPTFDVTPAACVDAVVTERGVLDGEAVGAVAAEHRSLRDADK
jgi:ribose 1,5-bisphosphate isomerase